MLPVPVPVVPVSMFEPVVEVPIEFVFIAEVLVFIRALTFTFVFESLLHPIIAALRPSVAAVIKSLLIVSFSFSFCPSIKAGAPTSL